MHRGRPSKFRDQLMEVKTKLEELRASLERQAKERGELAGSVSPAVLTIYDVTSKRRHGVALAEARAGICSICHVRLRPQVFNTVRRNEEMIQCDSCQQVLYFRASLHARDAR